MSISNNQSSISLEQPSSVSYPYQSELSTTSPSDQPSLSNEVADADSNVLAEPLQETHDPGMDNADSTPTTMDVPAVAGSSGDQNEVLITTRSSNEPSLEISVIQSPASQSVDQPQGQDTAPEQTDTNEDSTDATSPVPSAGAAHESEPEEQTTEAADEVPDWVTYTEDTSVPDEEEMKEIEESEYDKLSAHDIHAMEEQFFADVDDPDQRPVKKLRLSWLIKGVRGTRDRPNFARVMNSPGALVDGLYWSIKFYPRGDNCSSLSAFVRCSRDPPPIDEECPESEFTYYEGLPDANFSNNIEPTAKMTISAKDRPKPDKEAKQNEQQEQGEVKKQTAITESEDTSNNPPTTSEGTSETSAGKSETNDLPNWRVSAQLGMAIYNPVEPRTGHLQSDGHQFSKFCDDWGWVNFVGPWDEIHKRKRGQRQPLLQNDTMAIDAYVRIYEDPTEALWWHESKDESQWPSKELAGYFPMGTPGLYHSPAVAGITAWSTLR